MKLAKYQIRLFILIFLLVFIFGFVGGRINISFWDLRLGCLSLFFPLGLPSVTILLFFFSFRSMSFCSLQPLAQHKAISSY